MNKHNQKINVALTREEIVLISFILDAVKNNLITNEDDPGSWCEDYESWMISLDAEEYETLCNIVNIFDRIVAVKR